MKRVAAKPVNVLRTTNVAVAALGVAVLQKRVASQGFSKLVGTIRLTGGMVPAAGFPRVVEYQDGTTAAGPTRIYVLALDNSQPADSYPINVDLSCPYVGIEYTDGGAGGTILVAQAELRGT